VNKGNGRKTEHGQKDIYSIQLMEKIGIITSLNDRSLFDAHSIVSGFFLYSSSFLSSQNKTEKRMGYIPLFIMTILTYSKMNLKKNEIQIDFSNCMEHKEMLIKRKYHM